MSIIQRTNSHLTGEHYDDMPNIHRIQQQNLNYISITMPVLNMIINAENTMDQRQCNTYFLWHIFKGLPSEIGEEVLWMYVGDKICQIIYNQRNLWFYAVSLTWILNTSVMKTTCLHITSKTKMFFLILVNRSFDLKHQSVGICLQFQNLLCKVWERYFIKDVMISHLYN